MEWATGWEDIFKWILLCYWSIVKDVDFFFFCYGLEFLNLVFTWWRYILAGIRVTYREPPAGCSRVCFGDMVIPFKKKPYSKSSWKATKILGIDPDLLIPEYAKRDKNFPCCHWFIRHCTIIKFWLAGSLSKYNLHGYALRFPGRKEFK